MRILNQHDRSTNTVIVIGSGRSGTTMLCRICATLGFDWIRTDERNMESLQLRQAVQSGDMETIRAAVLPSDRQGVKLHMMASKAVLRAAECFPSPRFICPLRDTLAATESHLRQHVNGDLSRALKLFAVMNGNAVRSAVEISDHYPVAIVSYVDVMSKPDSSTHELASFLGVEWTPESAAEVVPRDPRYQPVPDAKNET